VLVGCGHFDKVSRRIAELKDTDASVRGNAAEALGNIKDPRAVQALLAAFKESDLAVIAGAYPFFIRRGEPGSENALIQALNAHGNERMAIEFLYCGNSALEAASPEWAGAHGYKVLGLKPGVTTTLRWGRGQ
jgi:hypothetical protein